MKKWCCNKIQNIESFFAVRKKKKVKTSTVCILAKTVHSTRYIYTHIYIYIWYLCVLSTLLILSSLTRSDWLSHSACKNWCCGTMSVCYWVTVALSELQREVSSDRIHSKYIQEKLPKAPAYSVFVPAYRSGIKGHHAHLKHNLRLYKFLIQWKL